MLRVSVFLSVFLFVPTLVASQGRTIVGDEFLGKWTTNSSVGLAKRQVLELFEDYSGTWTLIKDDGTKTELALAGSDIQITDDLLVIEYNDPKGSYKNKLVVAGWRLPSAKMIFGMLYLYGDNGAGVQLFNGVPITFEFGSEQMPPQVFWSFFTTGDSRRVTEGEFESLRSQLKKVEGIRYESDDEFEVFYLARVRSSIQLTKPSHKAHPSAMGVRIRPRSRTQFEIAGQYAGSEAKFKESYAQFIAEAEKVKKDSEERAQQMIEYFKSREDE